MEIPPPSPPSTYDFQMCVGERGGGGVTDQKPEKGLIKEFKTGDINYQYSCAVNVAGNYEINPSKIIKWGHFKDSKWSRHKIQTFRGARATARAILGPKKLRAPREVEILCRDHFESLKWPQLVIFKG
jgi:hypothetical protein